MFNFFFEALCFAVWVFVVFPMGSQSIRPLSTMDETETHSVTQNKNKGTISNEWES